MTTNQLPVTNDQLPMNTQQSTRKRGIFRFLPLVFCLFIFLSGCVRYDVGVDFRDQHHGEIVQHITLGQRLTTLSQTEANKWLNSLEERARKLNGSAKHLSDREIIVKIPFSNGQELVDKFNQFFNPNLSSPKKNNPNNLELLKLNSQLSIKQNNWLFVERNRLNLTVDLRALGVLSKQGNIIVSPGSLVDIDFTLNTPWGGQNLITDTSLTPEFYQEGNQLIWHLKPGEINTINTVFWTPSILGIGTVIIILLTLIGYFLKYKRLPGVMSGV